jgi:hypothetical protein
VGTASYRWFKGLGNAFIATGEPGVKIAEPTEAQALLEFIREQAADRRRVLFFCACPVERLRTCHRTAVATLLLNAASSRDVDLAVVEWPGGDPESRELRLTTEQEKRARGKTIPLGKELPTDGLATLPWGSTVTVRSGEQARPVLTGPAIFADEWRLPQLDISNAAATDTAALEARAKKLRAAWGCNPRR